MSKLDEKALELSKELEAELGAIELSTMEYTLADAIRAGSRVSNQAYTWGDGETACALTAAVIGAKAMAYL